MIDFLKRKFPNENYSLVFVPRELKNKKKEKKEKISAKREEKSHAGNSSQSFKS